MGYTHCIRYDHIWCVFFATHKTCYLHLPLWWGNLFCKNYVMSMNNVCNTCFKKIQSFSIQIKCTICHDKYHMKCLSLNRSDICETEMWYCPPCLQSIFVYNHYDEDQDFFAAVLEGILDHTFRLHEINSKVFSPFEINQDLDTPLSEIDPDLQYYSESNYIQNMNCDYYFGDSFQNNISNNTNYCNKMSFFHINIKSLPKHFDDLDLYLNSLDYTFSFVGLTETWLDESKHDLFDLPGYNCVNRFRKGKKGGGVTLCLRYGIPYKIRDDLQYFDSEMESVFIEIDSTYFGTSSNVVIGIVYRMPDSSVEVFNERITDIMNVIHRVKKVCYLLGDLNIDLFKCDDHKPTSNFLDTMYSYNMFPLIVKPTRVTEKSATLIDHIWTNNFDVHSQHKQGILLTSMPDHYGIFHITGSKMNESSGNENVCLKRDMCHRNIEKFISKIQAVDWKKNMTETNAQQAYSKFHETITELYKTCFPFRKMKKQYHYNKPWLTAALKESIKMKNKLFVNKNKGDNIQQKNVYYKIYRNKLNHLMRTTERKHYQDLIKQHKSNANKSWQIIKMIINKRKYTPANSKFKCKDSVIEDGKLISDKFNNFFCKCRSYLSEENWTQLEMPYSFHFLWCCP